MCDSSHQILALRLGKGASLKSKTEQVKKMKNFKDCNLVSKTGTN